MKQAQIRIGAKIHHRFRLYEWPNVPVPDGQSEIDAKTIFEVIGKTETDSLHLSGPGFEAGSVCIFARKEDLIEQDEP